MVSLEIVSSLEKPVSRGPGGKQSRHRRGEARGRGHGRATSGLVAHVSQKSATSLSASLGLAMAGNRPVAGFEQSMKLGRAR